MNKKDEKTKSFILLSVFCLVLVSVLTPIVSSTNVNYVDGFDKGPSYIPVVPVEKVTFVNHDKDSLLDDYSYLASVPTSVFREDSKLFSNPLLFYEDEYDVNEEKEVTLNARKGLDYFMEDWMSYCNGKLDQMNVINIPKEKVDQWDAREYNIIQSEDPYDIASKIALQDWSYSNKAVLAVIEKEFEQPDVMVENTIEMSLPACDVYDEETFDLKQTNSLNPMYHTFDVGDEYKYLEADCWWDGLLIAGSIMMPTGDPDMQIYCRQDGDWMQTSAVAAWNVYSPIGHEPAQAYIYKPGEWRIGITDMPTESDSEYVRKNIVGNLLQLQGSLRGLAEPGVTYHVDVKMYPGIDIKIPDIPSFGSRNVEFKLNWDNPEATLGFTIVGPSGEAVFTALEELEEGKCEQVAKLYSLGECLEDEYYSVSVFSMNDVDYPLDFELEYSWQQNVSKEQGDSLTSATEGSVLASGMNAPLLYTSASELSSKTKEALYKLGVEDIYLVNIGSHLDDDVLKEIKDIAKVSKNYKVLDEIYTDIREISGSNDIVFSTIDPWTYWYLAELKPGGDTDASLFIGPAAYIASHHGTPVLLVEMHPELSSAITYHNEVWRHFSYRRYDGQPSSGEMVLTGKRIYDFLEKYGFDKEGDENIITVADQYDIGVPWDRIFIGVANSGRFCGSPVDTAYFISRNMFYPALIFVNPAMDGERTLIQGTTSHREGLLGLFQYPFGNTLVIDRQSGGELQFENPVLCSFVTQKYRFNERASNYYGAVYECADGKVPGESVTNEPIDMGSIEKWTGKEGAYFPDMSETEMVPFYLERGGFEPVFSTQFEAVAENLNRGVIMWIHSSHGSHKNGGNSDFWEPSATGGLFSLLAGPAKQENPKWGYDWYLGSTEEPDTMSMDINGIIPFTNHDSLWFPATGFDYVLARKPLREIVNKILIPRNNNFPFNVENMYDGVTGSLTYTRKTIHPVYSTDLDEELENLHSAGFMTNICQTAYTNFQLEMIRHGTVFQIEDPWATSWYATVWRQSIPRDLALGYTIGEAFARGIKHVGILYLGGSPDGGPQWWWDTAESVVYFGDPELRIFVPSTDYSDNNNWDKEDTNSIRYDSELDLEGHMPFGATDYPNEKVPMNFFEKNMFVLIILLIVVILVLYLCISGRKNKD